MNYILGGGITGLIWKYYRPEYKIITQNIGGQMASKFNLGPRLLHVNPDTEMLLKKLRLSVTKKKISVGYGYPIPTMFPRKNFREQYYFKSRNLNKTKVNNLDESVMTGNKSYYLAYTVEMDELVKALIENINHNDIVQDKIISIDTKKQIVCTENSNFKYNKVISTIPKKIFCNLAKIPDSNYQSSSTLFVLTDYPQSMYIGYNYVYVSDDKTPFHRVSKIDQISKNLVFELSEKYDICDLEKYFIQNNIDVKIIDSIRVAGTQIRTNLNTDKFSNIIFSGRYGTWNHNIKTEDVIREAKDHGQS